MEINKLINVFDKLYPNAKCSLNYSKDYELLIAVMLSAQATDESVNKVTKILFKKYPTLASFKKAKLEDVEKIIHPIGLSKVKSKNVINIVKSIDKKVSNNKEELLKLHGVGNKVANCVLAELFNEPFLAVDTHVYRIARRMKLAKVNDSKLNVEKKLIKLFPKEKVILLNHQIIEFGRCICTARNPKCLQCPFSKFIKCNLAI